MCFPARSFGARTISPWDRAQNGIVRCDWVPAAIVAGSGNTIQPANDNSAIVAGHYNLLESGAAASFIGGGNYNNLKAGSAGSAIVGGIVNTNASSYAAIGGGWQNLIET